MLTQLTTAYPWIQWVFDGVGIAVIGAAWHIFQKKRKGESTHSQVQKAGDNSYNVQVGGNVDIHRN